MSEVQLNSINTDLTHYTLDDVLNLLNIDINELDTYDDVNNAAKQNIDKYTELFTKNNNIEMVTFFNKLKNKYFTEKSDNNITISEDLVVNNENYNTNRKQITKLLTVDSRFRNNYLTTTSTDYTINLPYIINNVIELKLSDTEFPTTFYPFNDEHENNYFWIKYTYTSAYSSTDTEYNGYVYIYIPPSNYYYQTVIDNINTTMSDANLPISITFDLDFNNAGGIPNGTGTAKIEVDNSEGSSIVISNLEINFKCSKIPDGFTNYNVSHILQDDDENIAFYNTINPINYKKRGGWMFGFRKDYYSGSTSYTSEGLLEILGPRYVYFVLNDFNNNVNVNFFTNNEESMLSSNVLARISLKGSSFSIQSQTDFSVYTQPRYYYGPVNIDKLHVSVIDEFGRNVNLNGSDFAFTIGLTVVYDNN